MQIIIGIDETGEKEKHANVTVEGREYLFCLTSGSIIGEYDAKSGKLKKWSEEYIGKERAELEKLICEAIDDLADDHVEVMQ